MMIPAIKIKAILLYFAANTDPRLLGKKKLMKLFYFIDFTHVKKYGSPITFDNYVHLEYGPIPSTILNLVNEVENDMDSAILSDTISVEIKPDSLQKKIVAVRKFSEKDKGYFTENELNVMKSVCERFGDKTGKYIEDRSHEEAAWRLTTDVEAIPYTLAVNDPDCLVEKEDIELSMKILGD